ncbi:putative Class I SAM-dependent methyltransferase [Candidatus Magnetomoraceae bacterium gMMP-1]
MSAKYPLKSDIKKLISEQNSDPYYNLSALKGSAYNKNRLLLKIIEFIKLYLWGGLKYFGIYDRLLFSNLILSWFYEFKEYWVNELQGSNIRPHDFFFLLGDYRKEADYGLGNSQDGKEQIEVWQDQRGIYYLLSQRYKVALNPFEVRSFAKYIKKNSLILEYGCGMGPIARSLERFYRNKNFKMHCVDIPTFPFHYIRWYFKKYRKHKFVDFIEIRPDTDNILQENYDAIFMLNVLEHLPRPLKTIVHATEHLNKGGYLIFNYIDTEGDVLDTKAGMFERKDVLRYITEHYEIVQGVVNFNKTTGNTVAKKR